MVYEKTPIKNGNSKNIVKAVTANHLGEIKTGAIVWHLVKRHKFGLVVSYAAVISAFYFVPFLPDVLFGLIGR